MKSICVVLSLLVVLSAVVSADNWPQFRGPNGTGTTDAKNIPVKFAQTDYNWKIKLPGGGHSSPVIWDKKLFITSAVKNVASILAIDTESGKILWQKDYTLPYYRMNRLNHYAAGTPACDKDKVYVIWATADQTTLVALDHNGNEKWTQTFGPTKSQHGPCKSAFIHGNMLIFTMEQKANTDDLDSCWIAVDKTSGKPRWRTKRYNSSHISYSPPNVYTPENGKPQLIFASKSHGLTGVDPTNGKVLWEVISALPARSVGQPVIFGDMVIANCGDGGTGKKLTAVRPPKTPSADPQVAYELTENSIIPYVSSLLVADNLMFSFHDKGKVTCFDAATGKVHWSEKPGGRFYCSPVCIEGKVYCMNMDGQLIVIKASPKYQLLAINDLGEETQATIAVANGKMYLRTLSNLISIGK